jgi:predicted GTPase
VNLRRAQIIVINKANSATGDVVEKLQGRLTKINPGAAQVVTDSIIKVDDPNAIAGKRVLVVEDGPTITHGGMPHGAGMAAAGLYAAGEVVDPRPYAVGSIADAFRKYPHIGAVLPAVGYSKNQIEDLQETIGRIACDIVVSATPVDLAGFMEIDKPIVHVTYEIREREGNRFDDIISRFVESHFSRS